MSDEYQISPLDEKILELNHEGHSNNSISKLLKERFDIELSKSAVGRHLLELRQNPDNYVQANFECPIIRQPK
jgi:intein-encoded DNA endonuclease-like protein